MEDKERFKDLMVEAASLDPANPQLYYNIGVVDMEQGNIEGARAAFRKSLEIDPGYTNAIVNLSITYVNEGNELVDEMNNLGNSKEDITKYNTLKEMKDNLFREGANILENALKLHTDNHQLLDQLKHIYVALNDTYNLYRINKLIGN